LPPFNCFLLRSVLVLLVDAAVVTFVAVRQTVVSAEWIETSERLLPLWEF
jgi:hypothetical protein